jgi:tyrosinase-like protein
VASIGVRKSFRALTTTERDNFLRALLTIKNTIANPAAPAAQRISVYDQFSAIHFAVLAVRSPGSGGLPVNTGHQGAGFGPWHREFLRRFELALQAVDPNVNLPYWDWSDQSGTDTILFQDAFIGPNGGAGGVGGGNIASGYFAFDRPGTGGNTTPLPPWWPAGLAGWRLRTSLSQSWGDHLQRAHGPFGSLATKANVLTTLGSGGSGTPTQQYNAFRAQLEGGARMHNYHHGWVGGQMGDPTASPNDPIFYLHHCNIDRLWAMWQLDGHQGSAYYPASGQLYGHNLNDPMWPWIGGLPGFSSDNVQSDAPVPDFSAEPQRRPVDTMDHHPMGYAYDTEVVVGVALDQTGSMAGLTPDPMTGGPLSVSKWEAAKQGVSFMLQDCESAYAQGEAYVTAGVETFRSLAGNVFTPIFAGTPYGLIKNGTAYSRTSFDAAIAAQPPAGGTPLAGALTDTETNLVRAPFGNQPPDDQRYLFMLTDGIETAPPLLSSLPAGGFADTVIFAMGFGVGSGWNGVDYATITTIAAKGASAPPGVDQVFHGENAGVIDKFYSNSIAAAIGYVPLIDPIYELMPGEHAETPFYATSSDESFMITATGFDLVDGNWSFCVVAPDGSHCGDAVHGHHDESAFVPFDFSMVKRGARATIFLHRSGAPASSWVGRWTVRAMYRMAEDDPDMVMFMPSRWDLLLPAGAPPVRGPLYTRAALPPAKRSAVRLLRGPQGGPILGGNQGVSTLDTDEACAVAVNVYAKPSLDLALALEARRPFAGADLLLSLELSDRAGRKIDVDGAVARLVAPAHSLGNALADAKTIPPRNRRKYLRKDTPAPSLDLLRYLADYERKRPDAFRIRDEAIRLTRRQGKLQARIRDTQHPGVYHLGVLLEGTLTAPGGQPERFLRVASKAVGLGIEPDRRKTTTALEIAKNRLVVTATPTDRLGNVALPLAAPTVYVNGRPVRAERKDLLGVEQRLEVPFEGEARLLPDGRTEGGPLRLETPDGDPLLIDAGTRIQVELELGQTRLPVAAPRKR